MDRKDSMSLPGSATYYTQRGGISESGTRSGLYAGMHPLHNQSMPFRSNIGNNSIESTIQIEQSSTISPHNVNVGVPSAVPPSEPVKRKRGRPRKYGPDGAVSLALSPSSSAPPAMMTSSTQKRGRGRPPGTGRKQQLASLDNWLSGSAGMGFTPHVITIALGEDITTKIMSFSQQGPRAVCVLSANGSVSTVTLHQPSTSGGTVTYEGRFEILCLSGSYLLTHNAGSRNRSGGLSVTLASPDGRVIGGGVGGVLIAATPIQVIMGSFLWGDSKTKNKAREGPDDATDSDVQTVDYPITPTSAQHSQHLNLTSSSMGVWRGSRSVDMPKAHVEIDLMRE